jgi:dolichol-phosphate mannosyltransferase
MVNTKPKVAVIIPAFKVKEKILDVISKIGDEVHFIYVIDDLCPQNSGEHVLKKCKDKRVRVFRNTKNLGVGGAVISGYKLAIKDEIDIAVKIDGDGQMNPELITHFITPIIEKIADYTKGNRFYNLDFVKLMPKKRLLGNAVLSFFSKISTGYWDIYDPTNGYTAIHIKVLNQIDLDKVSKRYFFESDMLFRLNIIRAVVQDIPIRAIYGDEKSNLRIQSIIVDFIFKHFRNTFKRIFYNYILRDMSLATFELFFGFCMLIFGILFGLKCWYFSLESGVASPTGSIMISFVNVILGFQFILAFLNYDISNIPKTPLQKSI